MFNLACSYNPAFLKGLVIPDVKLMEMGLDAYFQIFNRNHQKFSVDYNEMLSIHLSRSPITEDDFHQDVFIKEKVLPLIDDERIISFGFHLCGNRRENIGKFGFSSHYFSSEDKEKQAIRFIQKIEILTQKPVWIENANFYSSSAKEIHKNWESVHTIINKTKGKLILDISHLIIDCVNNNISPYTFLGMIDWNSVSEIHLSGIIEGKDSTLHDGHSKRIPQNVWEIFEEIISINLLRDSVFVNIEHSEECWGSKKVSYKEDFLKLKKYTAKRKNFSKKDTSQKSESYAKNYLKKNLQNAVSNLDDIAKKLTLSEHEILEKWLSFIEHEENRISLSKSDMDSLIAKESIFYIESFKQFIKKLNENRD